MDSRLIKVMIVIISLTLIIYIPYALKSNGIENKQLFPYIIGDMILRSNETGNYFIKSMVSYDDFRGPYIQGYKATYSGRNGTMIIFVAQMQDNNSANGYFNDMAVRLGYNPSINQSFFTNNVSVIKLPVNNPTVYAIRKEPKSIWHYALTKADKVYWIGFNNSDIEYQVNILREAYMKIDGYGYNNE